MEKPAHNRFSIIDPLAKRWSPRSFADTPVEPEKLQRAFEALRWSASSYNEQPWRFMIATKDQPDEYQKVLSCLVEKNQQWAQLAPVLGLTLSKKTFSGDGSFNRVHVHDLGLGMGNLTVQLTADNVFIHQMAGIVPDKVKQTFNVPDDFEAIAGFAIGYGAEPEKLPEDWMQQAERADRERMAFKDFIFTGQFGAATNIVTE